jgi:hypothetical protein
LGSGIGDPSSGIRKKTPSGSRIQGSKRHRIPDPQHWFLPSVVLLHLVMSPPSVVLLHLVMSPPSVVLLHLVMSSCLVVLLYFRESYC